MLLDINKYFETNNTGKIGILFMSFLSMIKAIKLTIYYSLHAHKVKPNSQCVEYKMKEKIF